MKKIVLKTTDASVYLSSPQTDRRLREYWLRRAAFLPTMTSANLANRPPDCSRMFLERQQAG